MLDITTTPAPTPTWAHTLRRGDIVLFRFPCAEENPVEAPKSRTCLVLDVETREGRLHVHLAYGTSAWTRANVGNEIHIETPQDMAVAGVRKPTRVVCDRRTWATPEDPGWDLNPRHRSPVVGRLSPRGLAQMNAIRAKLQARIDIAAEHRSSRGRAFSVEHRRKRTLVSRLAGARA
jgi:hypothetical protein